MGNIVYSTAWIPDKCNNFHQAGDGISIDDLPEDFIKNETLASRLELKLTKSLYELTDELYKKYKRKFKPEHLDYMMKHPDKMDQLVGEELGTKSKPGTGSDAETGDSLKPVDFQKAFAETFSRPGSIQLDIDNLPPSDPRNPDLYARKAGEAVSSNKANEPPSHERFKKVPTKKWETKNNEVRIFLQEEYKGKCQICSYTFPKRDSQPYFEGLYLVSQTLARWIDDRGNVLCLCANCCAKFKQGSVEADYILRQINEEVKMVIPVLNIIRLCGE